MDRSQLMVRSGVSAAMAAAICLAAANIAFLVAGYDMAETLLISAWLAGVTFGLAVITFRAPQGIAGIGLQMFGVGTAGTLFRHFVGGTQSIPGIDRLPIPVLSEIPLLGPVFFSHNPLVYLTFLLVPAAWYILFRTPWGLRVRASGTNPRAADRDRIHIRVLVHMVTAPVIVARDETVRAPILIDAAMRRGRMRSIAPIG